MNRVHDISIPSPQELSETRTPEHTVGDRLQQAGSKPLRHLEHSEVEPLQGLREGHEAFDRPLWDELPDDHEAPDHSLWEDLPDDRGRIEDPADNKEEETPEIMEPPVVITFTCPPGVDPKEFARQLKGQERGINSQTIAQNMKNRKDYQNRKDVTGDGRDPEAAKAQKIARDKAFQSRIKRNMEKLNMSYADAKKEAEDWMKKQAALHNPDQIAGGDPAKVSRIGDASVNSSIGGQWKQKVKELQQAVDEFSKNYTADELEKIKMNVKLVVL